MMKERKGAVEFTNGTWAKSLKIPKEKKLLKLKRTCLGCHDFGLIKIDPLGQLFEIDFPVCEHCASLCVINNNNNNMSTNPIEKIQTIISEKKKVNEEFDSKMKAEIDGLVSAFASHLENAHAVYSILTSPEIGHSADELLKNEKVANVLKVFGLKQKSTTHTDGDKQNAGKKKDKLQSGEKPKTTKDWIQHVLIGSDGMTRPEIQAAIEKQTKAKVFNLYTAVSQLVKAKILVTAGKKKFKLA